MFQKNLYLQAAVAACVFGLSPGAAPYAQDANDEPIEELVVRAHPLSAENIAQPIATLSGKELERALAPSIAETLRDVPGVTSSSFGQAVGRPVVRGLGGARVKTMEDRIDSMDVSVSSPDHLTTIDPFAANSIEVLKGPATLLYGSGAIGGVVDVHTGRIPHTLPDEVSARAELRTADNADRQSGAAVLEFAAGSFAFHVDGFYRDADEFDIPGFAESAALRALEEEEEHEEGEEEHEEEEEAFGTLPGSQMDMHGGAVGVSYVGESGFFGVALSTFDADYGLPGGHGHHHEEGEEEEGEEEEEGNPVLDMDQTRVDVEAGFDVFANGIDSINFRLGINDYEHTEFEGNGEAGTVFTNEAMEGRVEIVHESLGGFMAAAGLQFSSREFSAIGEEAFVQPVESDSLGLFWVGQRRFGETGMELGFRYERVDHEPTEASSRGFSLGAASIGLIQPLSDTWTLSGQLDVSSRAPVAEELYSNGPHLATQSFEIGDVSLTEERATNVSASLEYDNETMYFLLNTYYTDFSDFIYESATGAELDELPVLQWQQADASFSGFEAAFAWDAVTWQDGTLSLNAGLDYVDARLDSGPNRNIPRIPPLRYRLGATLNWQDLLAEVAWSRVDSQSDTAFGELPTDAYNDLRIHLSYAVDVGDSQLEFFLSGRNLTDDEQRYHTSFIKDFAPQPGRTIEAGVIFRL